ncbi:hypothetical protein LTR64_001237 [Lithohypha guttulata]|uniref:uncharacterized protein n=1 Tax=Lithohypha guttulata TaxID=1690604 RepID=UPI00315C730F
MGRYSTGRAHMYLSVPHIADAFGCAPINSLSLPSRPTDINPIFDEQKHKEPLAPRNTIGPDTYGLSTGLDAETFSPPSPPTDFRDPYLYPVLTGNEYVRLTTLWYHTQGLTEDKDFLWRISNLLGMLKDSIRWEFAIVGILDNDHYTRLVTANLPILNLPRRESTCSHTVNMSPGTVFMITDMSKDWRFQNSPHVAIGGLRSYAGTQLRIMLADGIEIALGSLCIASNTVEERLTEDQKRGLLRAADTIAAELVSRTRMRRLNERQNMLNHLSHLRAADSDDPQAAVIRLLTTLYGGVNVSLEPVVSNAVKISGTSVRIECSKFTDGLWEDTEFIKHGMQDTDAFSDARRPIRAVFAYLRQGERALIVASGKLRCIFDSLDAWFVDQCAQFINSTLQDRLLREALCAKDLFLRSITHELRTPLHGILSSAELMDEELRIREVKGLQALFSDEFSFPACLSSIKRSGRELMTSINSILKFNAFADDTMIIRPTEYDIRDLEDTVLDDVLPSYASNQLQGLSILFEYHLPDENTIINVDANVLKELLKSLLTNSISATSRGRILVRTTLLGSCSQLDVIDTGMGIAGCDQERVFLPFEKGNTHSTGAGLGLSLAVQMATSLGGSLSLIWSELGKGSHFQLKLPYSRAVNSHSVFCHKSPTFGDLPLRFYKIRQSARNEHLLSHLETHLISRGFEKADGPRGSVIITNQAEPFQPCYTGLSQIETPLMVITVTEGPLSSAYQTSMADDMKPHLAWYIHGPFYKSRLDEIMLEADHAFGIHISNKSNNPSYSTITITPSDTLSKVISNTSQILSDTLTFTTTTTTHTRSKAIFRVLLVDDNHVNLKVLEMYCKKRILPFGKASNGNEAVSSYKAAMIDLDSPYKPYNLILMDLQMPECDGIEACRQIRQLEQDNGLKRSVIFMITGQDSVADRRNSLEAGADEYFVKPVSLKRLDQALVEYFRL